MGVNPFLKKAAPKFEVGEQVTVEWDAGPHGRLRHSGCVSATKPSDSGVWVSIDGGQRGTLSMFDYLLRRVEEQKSDKPNPFIEKAKKKTNPFIKKGH